MKAAKLPYGISQLSLPFAITLRGAVARVCANTRGVRVCNRVELWWPVPGEGKVRNVTLECWNMILLHDVLACDLKWQSEISLGPFSCLIFMLNITQSRLVNACIHMYSGVFKYKVGRALLWMLSPHTQHNPLFPSMQKPCPLLSVPLFYMFTFHQKSDGFIFEYKPQISGAFRLWEAQRYSCSLTAMTVNSHFSTIERTLTKLECTFLIMSSIKGWEKSL